MKTAQSGYYYICGDNGVKNSCKLYLLAYELAVVKNEFPLIH